MAENAVPSKGMLIFVKCADGAYRVASAQNDGTLNISGSITASLGAFSPKASATRSASTSSANVALPSADAGLVLRNTGSVDVFFKLGGIAVAAATTDFRIKAGDILGLDATGSTYIAAITASGSSSLDIWTGTGLISAAQAGGSGGAGGAVTITDRTEVSGSASSAAVLSGFPVTDTTGYRSMALQVTAMAASSTLLVEESNDGTTWTALTSIGGMASVTAVGLYVYNFSAKQVRVRQSVYGGAGTTSATAELRLDAAPHDYAIGALADAQATDATSSWSVIALLKGLYTKLGAVVLATGSAIIGKVGIDQTTPGTTDSVSVATGQGAGATIGVTTGAAVITDANGTVQQYLRGLVKQWIAGTLVLGAGTNLIGYTGHGKTIKTVALSAVTVDTDLVAAVVAKRIKVIAYALFTTGTSASTLNFKSNGVAGTLLASVMLQSQASAVFGANLAIAAPSFLFATVAGEKLTLDVGNTDPITGFITYFDDDAT